MIPTAHLSPQPKRHPDWFSRFCTDVTLEWGAQNCPFPWGDLDPYIIHGSLGPS